MDVATIPIRSSRTYIIHIIVLINAFLRNRGIFLHAVCSDQLNSPIFNDQITYKVYFWDITQFNIIFHPQVVSFKYVDIGRLSSNMKGWDPLIGTRTNSPQIWWFHLDLNCSFSRLVLFYGPALCQLPESQINKTSSVWRHFY